MRLRDRLSAALQTFREAPDLRSRLNEVEFELKIADQALELREKECDRLRETVEEKDSLVKFLNAQSIAHLEALREFSPRLSSTEDMKRFYDALSVSLDPDGFLLYRMAEQIIGVDVTSIFPYENARGMFEAASGHQLMDYLTAYCFDAVEWEIVPGTTYERAVLEEVDTTTPEYQQFEHRLYKRVLKRMGFDEFLAPEPTRKEQEPQIQEQAAAMTMS